MRARLPESLSCLQCINFGTCSAYLADSQLSQNGVDKNVLLFSTIDVGRGLIGVRIGEMRLAGLIHFGREGYSCNGRFHIERNWVL